MRHDEIDIFIRDAVAGTLELTSVDEYCRTRNLCLAELCNAVALAVARRFDDATMTYQDADAAMNNVWGLIVSDFARHGDGYELPEPAFSIYEAFDAGEYSRRDGEDPVELHTRPRVKRVLRDA